MQKKIKLCITATATHKAKLARTNERVVLTVRLEKASRFKMIDREREKGELW